MAKSSHLQFRGVGLKENFPQNNNLAEFIMFGSHCVSPTLFEVGARKMFTFVLTKMTVWIIENKHHTNNYGMQSCV